MTGLLHNRPRLGIFECPVRTNVMSEADADDDLSMQFTIGEPAATLVVRAWLEPVAGGEPVLRGTVAQLGGRMLGAFGSLETLVALVEAHVADKSS